MNQGKDRLENIGLDQGKTFQRHFMAQYSNEGRQLESGLAIRSAPRTARSIVRHWSQATLAGLNTIDTTN